MRPTFCIWGYRCSCESYLILMTVLFAPRNNAAVCLSGVNYRVTYEFCEQNNDNEDMLKAALLCYFTLFEYSVSCYHPCLFH